VPELSVSKLVPVGRDSDKLSKRGHLFNSFSFRRVGVRIEQVQSDVRAGNVGSLLHHPLELDGLSYLPPALRDAPVLAVTPYLFYRIG
jgi:hypothetical protein